MTTVIDYAAAAAELEDSYFLGQIVSFTINETDVPLDTARDNLVALNLRTDTMRKRLRPIDAFKKAANEIAVKFDRDPLADEQHGLLVRPVGQDSSESHRHIVFERAIWKTGNGRRRVEHETIWKLMYDRGKRMKDGSIIDDAIHVEQQATIGGVKLSPVEQAWVDAHIGPEGESLKARYEHWKTHLDSHAVRTFVREYVVDLLGGISIKGNSGGLYFVEQKHINELRDLMTFVKNIGSHMHTIPLLDIVEQREMLAEAFIQETMDEIRQQMVEINKIMDNPTRTITEDTYDTYTDKAVNLIAKHKDYAKLLDRNLDTADTELQIFQQQVLTLFNRVKKPKTLGSGKKT